MQYKQVKYHKCIRLPDSGGGSWIVILNTPSWVHYRLTGPSFDALSACVPLSISSHMHIVPNVTLLPRSLCAWTRTSLHVLKEGHNHLIVHLVYLCHMISEEFVFKFLSFLCIKLFEFGVEVAFNNRSAVTHHRVNLLKFPLQRTNFECICGAAHLLLLLSPLGTPWPCLSTV